jgi:hypothetical protein
MPGDHPRSLTTASADPARFGELHPYDVEVIAPAELKDRAPRWVKTAANASTRAYAMGTVELRPYPDYLIVGSKRGGTTSLHNYLLAHPGVLGLFPQPRGKKSTQFFFPAHGPVGGHGEAWYRSHFHAGVYRRVRARQLGYRPLSGEASPYYIWDARVAPRVRAVVPEVKAILLLRDPVERAWSHYWERRSNGVEPLSFADAIHAEDDRTEGELERMADDPGYYSEAFDFYTYRQRGNYLPQLQNWLRHFPREQLLVLRSEDMFADPQGAFDDVCAFLGLPVNPLQAERQFNGSSSTGAMDPAVRRELVEHFAPLNAALESFLGRDLRWS